MAGLHHSPVRLSASPVPSAGFEPIGQVSHNFGTALPFLYIEQVNRTDTMQASTFAIAPQGQVFPRFGFRALTNGKVSCTHHWTSQGLLRQRTDLLTDETAGQLITTLRNLGYKPTEFLG